MSDWPIFSPQSSSPVTNVALKFHFLPCIFYLFLQIILSFQSLSFVSLEVLGYGPYHRHLLSDSALICCWWKWQLTSRLLFLLKSRLHQEWRCQMRYLEFSMCLKASEQDGEHRCVAVWCCCGLARAVEEGERVYHCCYQPEESSWIYSSLSSRSSFHSVSLFHLRQEQAQKRSDVFVCTEDSAWWLIVCVPVGSHCLC